MTLDDLIRILRSIVKPILDTKKLKKSDFTLAN